jgi:hypothetical protein
LLSFAVIKQKIPAGKRAGAGFYLADPRQTAAEKLRGKVGFFIIFGPLEKGRNRLSYKHWYE